MNFEDFIEEMIQKGEFLILTHNFKGIPPHIIHQYGYAFGWGAICEENTLTEYEIEEYCRYFNSEAWMNCCHYQRLSEEFMRNHVSELDWDMVCAYQYLSEQFMEQFNYYLNWTIVSHQQEMSTKFIWKYRNKINFDSLDLNKLDEDFILYLIRKNKISWKSLPLRKKLSEQFLREYSDYMNWGEISTYQILNPNFVREFANKIEFTYLLINEHVGYSDKFVWENRNKIDSKIWHNYGKAIEKRYGYDFYKKYTNYCTAP